MLRVGLIGLGKMGISHLAIINAHPGMKLVALCDSGPWVPDVLGKYMGVKLHSDYVTLFAEESLDAVFIATPTRFHGPMVRAALDQGFHVFCEKPFCLDVSEGRELAELARQKGLVNQVGYHFRFVGAFKEAKRLLEAGVLGKLHHVRAEAYGSVVLRSKGSTWRTGKGTGGGCLYEYACHVIDLVNYLVGAPQGVEGTMLNKIFSRDVEDEVYSALYFANGATGQLAANWSDESYRKMYARITLWGTNGRLTVDRQELQVFIRDAGGLTVRLEEGWNVRYTTELTPEVWYYLRGEEYSEQIDHFVQCIVSGPRESISSFSSAVETDGVVAMMLNDAEAKRSRATFEAKEKLSATGSLLRNLKRSFR